jgi:hypothetical protein
MTRMVRTLVLVSFAVAVARAHAQPAAAQAEIMFRKGKQLLADGKTAEACAAFDASQKLDPTVSTLLNQANCREKNGQLATAWGLFLEAERQTRGGGDENKQLHQVATGKVAKLEPRLSMLTINADAKVAGLEVRRDTTVIDPVTYNQALPIDGGTYKITAKAPGKVEWSTTIKLENEKDAKTVTVPRLEEPKKAAPPPVTAPPESPWFCTDSKEASTGTCKPRRDQCEASRTTLKKQFSDLSPCYGATTASCFRIGNDLHCGPTDDICDALRTAAANHGAKVSPCRVQHDPKEPPPVDPPKPPPPPPAPPKPKGPQWWCTDSRTRYLVGICKAERNQCEAMRSSMAQRTPDLSSCHEVETAMCFQLDSQSHCAPTGEICDAMREAARKDDRSQRLGNCTKMTR